MDEKEKLAEMAEKQPRKALIYGMGIVIAILAGVCSTLFFKLEAAKNETSAALKVQAVEFREEIKDLKQDVALSRKETKDCTDQQITRTDKFVDQITNTLQKQIDEHNRIESERNRLKRERSSIITKDRNNLNKLDKPTSQTDEN
jgi:gas vesicle protein